MFHRFFPLEVRNHLTHDLTSTFSVSTTLITVCEQFLVQHGTSHVGTKKLHTMIFFQTEDAFGILLGTDSQLFDSCKRHLNLQISGGRLQESQKSEIIMIVPL